MVALTASDALLRDYVGQLNLHPFFDDPAPNLVGLLTLSYVPNYFDILPMYLVVLVMLPAVVALAGLHRAAAALAVVAVWAVAQTGHLSLPAEPWSDRAWFFKNPFGWQLIFFTGFALMSGWLPAPPVDRRLVWLARRDRDRHRSAGTWADLSRAFRPCRRRARALGPLIGKTDFGNPALRPLPCGWPIWPGSRSGRQGARLSPPEGDGPGARAWRTGLAVILKVGQQSLRGVHRLDVPGPPAGRRARRDGTRAAECRRRETLAGMAILVGGCLRGGVGQVRALAQARARGCVMRADGGARTVAMLVRSGVMLGIWALVAALAGGCAGRMRRGPARLARRTRAPITLSCRPAPTTPPAFRR